MVAAWQIYTDHLDECGHEKGGNGPDRGEGATWPRLGPAHTFMK